MVGSLSVILVAAQESDEVDKNFQFHATSGAMASRELQAVGFWVCTTELEGCTGRLQSESSEDEGRPLHVWSHIREGCHTYTP